MPTPAELEQYLHTHIPLSQHIGIRAVEATGERVRLYAPLAPNLNHRMTAFGGSLSAVAILAGWSLLWVRLRDHTTGHRIVIHSSTMSYLEPVRSDFEATCETGDPEAWEAFERTFEGRGKARIELTARVHSEQALVAEFSGRYVVFRPGAFG